MNYTPPEPPAATLSDPDGQTLALFTESQLRSEVERVRRETVEECARVCIDLHANDQTNILYAAKVIGELK